MNNSLEKIFLIILSSAFICSCAVSIEESPAALGKQAGEIFVKEWNLRNSGSWPDSTSVAMYCVDVIDDFAPSVGWEVSQEIEFTDACSSAVAYGID